MVRVKVGTEYPDGTLDGEEIEFEGREVEVWEGPWESIDPNDQFVATFRLYDCPDGYRIHESVWSASGQPSRFELYPPVGNLGYGTYTEREAKERWEKYFGVLGT